MKLRYIIEGTNVIDTATGDIVWRNTSPENCERWLKDHQQFSPLHLTPAQLDLVDARNLFKGTLIEFAPDAWHYQDAWEYLQWAEQHPTACVVEVSSKRNTIWRGKNVCFNKAKSKFFEVLRSPSQLQLNIYGGLYVSDPVRDSFAPKMLCIPLELEEREQAELLNVWRHGKAEWYREHANLPLRARAETAKAFAIRNPS